MGDNLTLQFGGPIPIYPAPAQIHTPILATIQLVFRPTDANVPGFRRPTRPPPSTPSPPSILPSHSLRSQSHIKHQHFAIARNPPKTLTKTPPALPPHSTSKPCPPPSCITHPLHPFRVVLSHCCWIPPPSGPGWMKALCCQLSTKFHPHCIYTTPPNNTPTFLVLRLPLA